MLLQHRLVQGRPPSQPLLALQGKNCLSRGKSVQTSLGASELVLLCSSDCFSEFFPEFFPACCRLELSNPGLARISYDPSHRSHARVFRGRVPPYPDCYLTKTSSARDHTTTWAGHGAGLCPVTMCPMWLSTVIPLKQNRTRPAQPV